MNDLMAGNVATSFDTLTVTVPQIEAKRIKAIALAAAKRAPSLPNVPTVTESGPADFIASPWLGVVFPAGTPKEIVNRMNREVLKAMDDPGMQKSLQSIGAVPRIAGPEEFEKIIKADYVKWGKIVADSGAKVD